MSRVFVLLLASLLFVPTADAAQTGKVGCGAFHRVRLFGGTEMLTAAIAFRNANQEDSVTIERITIRNFFGDVVHDSGPATGVPHPLNTDFTPAQDITNVPPGASFYLSTEHIWGNNNVPGPAGAQQGNSMSVVVEFSTKGHRDLVRVGGSLRARDRVAIAPGVFVQGSERTRSSAGCVELK